MSLSDTQPLAPAWDARLLDEARALLRLATPIMLIALVNMGMASPTPLGPALFGAEALAAVAVGSDLYSSSSTSRRGARRARPLLHLRRAAPTPPNGPARALRPDRRPPRHDVRPLVWFAPDWLARLGLDPDLLDQGRGYTRAMAATLVPMLGVALYRTVLTAAEKPGVFLRVTLAMLPLNAVANYVLMTGVELLPLRSGRLRPRIASRGDGEPRDPRRGRPPRLGRARRGRRRLLARIAVALRLGLPVGIATVAKVGIFLAATLFAATLGAADVAAHTLTLRAAGIAYAVPTALLQAAMVRMARARTLDDPALDRADVTGSQASASPGALLLVVLAAAAQPLAHGFFDASPVGLAAACLAAHSSCSSADGVIFGPGRAAAGLLRGRKDTRAPMLFSLSATGPSGPPSASTLRGLGLGIAGVWIGLTAGTSCAALLTLARLARPRSHA